MPQEAKPVAYTLPKRERIHLKKEIDELFALGKGFVAYPLRVIYLAKTNEGYQSGLTTEQNTDNPPAKMLVSVGKRYFKRANKRNRVKRLVREAYRQNKHSLWALMEEQAQQIDLAFMFVGKELPTYKSVEGAVQKAFRRISKEMNPDYDHL